MPRNLGRKCTLLSYEYTIHCDYSRKPRYFVTRKKEVKETILKEGDNGSEVLQWAIDNCNTDAFDTHCSDGKFEFNPFDVNLKGKLLLGDVAYELCPYVDKVKHCGTCFRHECPEKQKMSK